LICYYQNNLWKFKTDYGTYVFIRHILNDLVSCFPIGVDDAINLINSYGGHIDTFVEGDIIYHELDLTWASYIYWKPHWELKDMRPMRENSPTSYELFIPIEPFNSDFVEDYIYIDSKMVSSYQEKGIISEKYIKTFEVTALNYDQALRELSNHKGEQYYKLPLFEGFY
jgi:hypothetical protein